MAFAKHHDPTKVDLDALSPWERELHERSLTDPPPAQDYAPPAQDETAGQDTAATALAVADAVLALLLSAQSSNPARAEVDWPTVLQGLVERGGAGQAELDGAKAWGLVDHEDHQLLLAQAETRLEAPGA